MPQRISLVNNGVVTSRDEAMLSEGELSRGWDGYYKPNSPTIWVVPGRTEWNSSPESSPIQDGRYLEFDNGNSSTLVISGTSILYGPAIGALELTGTLTSLVTDLASAPTTLDTMFNNNKYYAMVGVDRNRVIDEDYVVTLHSMVTNTVPPTFVDGSDETGYTLSTDVVMKYWVEEQVRNDDGVILKRSPAFETPVNSVLSVTGTGVLIKPRIYHAPFDNPDTTHWAVYSTSADGTFPVGASIGSADSATLFIDDTRTGTDPAIPSGALYELLSVNTVIGPAVTPRWGAAPKATTGDSFEGSLVTNDVDNPSHARFSYPLNPEAFPTGNVIAFNEKERDVVRVIRRMGQFLIVALRNGIERIDTLPQPTDAIYTTTQVTAKVDGAFGAVSSKAADLFSFGIGLRFAYVSRYGILVTDGVRWDVLTDDIDWENTVEVSRLDQSRLVNNRRLYRLEFLYVPKGETTPTKMLFLHYHPSHAKLGEAGGLRAKVSGPINRDARGIWLTEIDEVAHIFSGNGDGKVYVHDQGFVEPTAQGGIQFSIRSMDVYANNVGGEVQLSRLYVHHQAAPGQKGEQVTVVRREGRDDREIPRSIPLDRREASVHMRSTRADAYQLGFDISNPTAEIGIDFLGADFKVALRAEERGKS